MANQITGRIIEIGQTVQIPSKNGGSSFTKREFILDATTYDPYTGERSEYENVIPLEFSGDKCAELDRFNQGDVVTVSFVLQGRSWTNQDGELKRMASIRCYKIDARGGVSITINDIEIEKKEAMDEFKERLKPLNEEKQELLDHIKRGSEFVENEECAKILYHEEKMAGFYNKLGELVYSRPIMPQEMQKTVFSINRKTGTES